MHFTELEEISDHKFQSQVQSCGLSTKRYNTMQYHNIPTIPYNELQYQTLQYHAIPYVPAIPYNALQNHTHNAIHRNTTRCHATQYHNAAYNTLPCNAIPIKRMISGTGHQTRQLWSKLALTPFLVWTLSIIWTPSVISAKI